MTTSTGAAGTGVGGATAALDRHLAQLGPDRPRPALRYLRRKPGRGLVAVFGPDDRGAVWTVTVDEAAPGPVVRRFPDDPRLAELPTVTAPEGHGALAAALRAAAGPAGDATVLGIAAATVRYKPGDRCVLRYRLTLGGPGTGTTTRTVVAKLYREQADARDADALLTRLRTGPAAAWTARPLGVVPGLPLALTEDLGSGGDRVPARSGLRVVHPGSAEAPAVVRAAARALAELHTSGLDTAGLGLRTGADEAAKAAKRARVLEQHVPALAPEIRRVADLLCPTLSGLPAEPVRPAHGSYKPSQLLVRDGAVFVVDFDQCCRADPALDVGYFLAYLRPAGLWYHRAGRREWFEVAAEAFRSAYLERLTGRGETARTGAGVLARARVYEAALLLKIAARRANRLHSPRPGEVAAVLREVTACLGSVPRPRDRSAG
jgi:hypothetical protein